MILLITSYKLSNLTRSAENDNFLYIPLVTRRTRWWIFLNLRKYTRVIKKFFYCSFFTQKKKEKNNPNLEFPELNPLLPSCWRIQYIKRWRECSYIDHLVYLKHYLDINYLIGLQLWFIIWQIVKVFSVMYYLSRRFYNHS